MPLLGPARSRTATFSGTSKSGIVSPHLDRDEICTLACPGGTASIKALGITHGFEQDMVYGTQGNGGVWGPGASQQWRATMTAGSVRSASGPAGQLSATNDTLTVTGPWTVYNYPHTPTEDTSAYPTYGTITDTISMSGTAAFSGSLTLQEAWGSATFTTGNPTTDPWEKITAASLSVTFNASTSATFYYLDDSNVRQSLSIAYTYSGTWTASSSPNYALLSYSCSISAVTYTSVSWTLSWSLPGCSYSGAGVSLSDTHNRSGTAGSFVNGPGSSSLSGTAFSGTLTNTPGVSPPSDPWSSASLSWGPDRSFGATAQFRRYRDGAGIAGAPLKWTTGGTDPGQTVNTDASGMATGFVWPYDGSTMLEYSAQVNPGPGGPAGPLSSSATSTALFSMNIDPAWADANGYFLKPGSLGNFAGQMQLRTYRPFQIGTLQLDDSHSFDFFSSLSWWNGSAGTGSGTLSLDLGGVKLAPSVWPWKVTTLDGVKSLKCAFYRYYTVRVRSDQAGAQLKFGVGHRTSSSSSGFVYYYWTITVSAANTWEDHVIDLALPESDSLATSPLNYINHPGAWFDLPWGGFEITALTSGANYWLGGFTGFLKQTGTRTPSLLVGSLNAGYPDQYYQHSGTSTSDGGQAVERDYAGAADYSRASTPGLPIFGRLIVNGVIAADIRPIVNGSYAMSSGSGTIREFWTNFVTYWDTAANDTGLHLTATNDPLGKFDLMQQCFKRSGALPVRLNDTPGSPVTLSVDTEPNGHDLTLVGFPGCGDFWAGTYGTRFILQFHDYREGEMAGCLAHAGTPLRGRTLTFYRITDTATVIGTATSDDDGFWRWNAPYGSVRPYSNNPGSLGTSGSPDWLKQFTNSFGGPPTAWNSTALARRFQGYIAQLANFHDRDTSNFALQPGSTNRQLFYSFDRWISYFGFGDALASENGIDLVTHPVGWLYRSYRKDSPAGINVGRLIYGQSWVDVQVATDHDGAAVPTLFVHPRGAIGLLYHDTNGHGRLWWSLDLGATWQDRATWTSVGTYPRGVLLPDRRLVLVSFTGAGLTLHRSSDWQTASPPTLTSVATFASLPEQLAVLRCDRRGILHLVYVDATPQLLHRYSTDGGATWSAGAVLAAGDHPAYALGLERAAALRWVTTAPHGELTDEVYSALSGLPVLDLTALGAASPQYLGLAWDHRETLLAAKLDASGNPVVYYFPERHTLTALP